MSRWGRPEGPPQDADDTYTPSMSEEDAQIIRRWHEAAYENMRSDPPGRASYLGLDLVVPSDVFPTAGMSQLLGKAILDEVRPDDKVLDMGTGTGVNAILAASVSTDVVGVDINPRAVDGAIHNAVLNGVSDRTSFHQSDIFSAVESTFDLVIFDPPFRWFRPRDLLETTITDENYSALTRFMNEVRSHLNAGGRILLFFGTSGDIQYLYGLIGRAGFKKEVVASHELTKDGVSVTYYTFRLTL